MKSWDKRLRRLLAGNTVNFANALVGVKRKRRSLHDSLDESALADQQTSQASLDDVDPVVRLTAVNEVMGQKLGSIQSLFKKVRVRTHSRNDGGSVLRYGKKVKAYAISLMCQGESACSVHRSLKTLATICPEVMELSDGSVGEIPCVRTLSNWREQIPSLNDLHSGLFIDGDDQFILAVDESDVSNSSLLNIGIFNSRSEYICLASEVMVGEKNNVTISEKMKSMVEQYPTLIPKLIGVISDQQAAQLLANKRFARLIGREMDVDFTQYLCTMHSAKNQDDFWTKHFPIAAKAVHASKMLFGTRQTSENSKCSLRPELEIALTIENNRRFSPFKSDKGSRMAVGYHNAKALIENRELVLKVISIGKARENQYARDLRHLLTVDWNRCLAELGAYVIHWVAVLKPYFCQLGRKVELGLAKAIANELIDRNQQLVQSEEGYATLLGLITPRILEDHQYLAMVTQHWGTLDQPMKDSLNQIVKEAATKVKWKIDKDTKIILELTGDPHRLVPMSNNHCEASFAHVKDLHRKFSGMDKEYKAELAQARQNLIGFWLLEQSDEDLDQALSKVENEWRINKDVQKRLKHRRNLDRYYAIFDEE